MSIGWWKPRLSERCGNTHHSQTSPLKCRNDFVPTLINNPFSPPFIIQSCVCVLDELHRRYDWIYYLLQVQLIVPITIIILDSCYWKTNRGLWQISTSIYESHQPNRRSVTKKWCSSPQERRSSLALSMKSGQYLCTWLKNSTCSQRENSMYTASSKECLIKQSRHFSGYAQQMH